MPRILRREAAKRDLIAHFAYIGEHSSAENAQRFLEAVRQSLSELSRMPEIGYRAKFDKESSLEYGSGGCLFSTGT